MLIMYIILKTLSKRDLFDRKYQCKVSSIIRGLSIKGARSDYFRCLSNFVRFLVSEESS